MSFEPGWEMLAASIRQTERRIRNWLYIARLRVEKLKLSWFKRNYMVTVVGFHCQVFLFFSLSGLQKAYGPLSLNHYVCAAENEID